MLGDAEARERLRAIHQMPDRSREALLDRQRAWLLALVEHAVTRVHHYRESRTHQAVARELGRLGPRHRDFLDCYRQLPILERETLQSEGSSSLVAEGQLASRLLEMRSSGSTGRPIVALQTPTERGLYIALRSRTFRRLGLPRGPVAYVGIDSRTAAEKAAAGPESLRVVECRRPIAEVARELFEKPVEALIGYPGVLAELVRTSANECREVGVRLVVTSGEVLTPTVARSLGTGFGAPVRETYASSECFWIAGSDPTGAGLEVVEDGVFLEILREDGTPAAEGEEGEVVATPLHSFAQPLLRYRLGDRATRGPLGEPFSRLERVQGRVLDYLVLPGGGRIHAYEVTIPLRDGTDFLAQYAMTQSAPDRVLVRLLSTRTPTTGELERLRERLASKLPGITLDIQLVADLPRSASGKFRVVERTFDP